MRVIDRRLAVEKEKLMGEARDWSEMREMSARLLYDRTGEDVDTWKRRIQQHGFRDEKTLRKWLAEQGVSGYAQSLLVMEQFGYPDFLLASADDLIDAQYADRPHLRPIFDSIVDAMAALGDVTIQARKGYVSFITPRRTFARVRATTKQRVDLALRLEEQVPAGRLVASKVHPTMRVHVELGSADEVDSEVFEWLQRAFDENS